MDVMFGVRGVYVTGNGIPYADVAADGKVDADFFRQLGAVGDVQVFHIGLYPDV